ncbi:hypothetical protein BJX66DRAFT_339095 [Aspergillus keveii]|uniref:LysM domain-containing protein n=1 Tax=Aspergillus keveii TaxID=714993 RepID=A0ABR4G2G6_9EURO
MGLCAHAQRFSDGSFYDIDLPSVSDSCKEALNSTIACDRLLAGALNSGTSPSLESLDSICSADCVDSLTEYREQVAGACTAKADVLVVGNIAYNATYTAEELLYKYHATCDTEAETNDYCFPILASINDTLTPAQECSDCLLGRYQIDLSSHFGYSDRLAKQFSSLTFSCSETGYSYTSPTPIALNGTDTPTPTPVSCSDNAKYTIKDGDDCSSISLSQNVSTFALLHLNELQAYCKNFPEPGTSLCLPKQCQTYTLKDDDTCEGIVASQPGDISVTQLRSWNPNINKGCGNLFQWTGFQICVSPPGGELDPAITPTPTPSDKCEGLFQPTTCYTSPPTDIVWPDDPGVIPLPLAQGTWSNCTVYTTYLNSTDPEYDNACRSVSHFYGASVADLQRWNPSLDTEGACQIQPAYRYCAVNERSPQPTSTTGSPDPTSTSTTSSTSATSTTSITTSTSTTPDPTPSPVQEGIAENCTEFYEVQVDDGCWDLADAHGIALEDFYKWNPAVKNDCSMLLYGFWVCVGVDE